MLLHSCGWLLQAVADSKKVVGDEDILALLGDEASQEGSLWDLLDLQVGCQACCWVGKGRIFDIFEMRRA